MTQTKIDEILIYLNRIIELTQSGKIEWSKANPTTYVWTTVTEKPSRILVQKVERRVLERGSTSLRRITSYIFQVADAVGAQKFDINGEENSEINKRIELLFEIIGDSFTKKGLDFLDSILPK